MEGLVLIRAIQQPSLLQLGHKAMSIFSALTLTAVHLVLSWRLQAGGFMATFVGVYIQLQDGGIAGAIYT